MNGNGEIEKRGKDNSKALAGAVVLFLLALLYDVMPMDLIPDIPVIGWVDDFFITVTAGLNLLEKGVADANGTLAAILRFVKWGVVFLGIIAVALVGLGIFGIVKLVTN